MEKNMKTTLNMILGWWQYDDRTSQDIEEAYKKGEKSCIILVAGYVYIVDLEAMLQQRQNEPRRRRHVKRDLATIPKKGVAGLRIEDNVVITESNFSNNRVYDEVSDNDGNQGRRVSISLDQSIESYMGNLGLGNINASVGNPSEFVSTIAATDAAIRIASDIIGSTLAHADELSRQGRADLPLSHVHNSTAANLLNGDYINNGEFNNATRTDTIPDRNNQLAITAAGRAAVLERGSRELLGAAEDLLGATQRVIATADQLTIDLFEQTLDDFHALTLRNLVDSETDDDIELLDVSSIGSHNSDTISNETNEHNDDEQ